MRLKVESPSKFLQKNVRLSLWHSKACISIIDPVQALPSVLLRRYAVKKMGVQDSPLSVTASIAGILTFVYALAAGLFFRIQAVRHSDLESFEMLSSQVVALNGINQSARAAHRLLEAEPFRWNDGIEELTAILKITLHEMEELETLYFSFNLLEKRRLQVLARKFRFVMTKDQLSKKFAVKNDLLKRLGAVQRTCVQDPVVHSIPHI